LTQVNELLAEAFAPPLPLWDTEVNYGLAGPGPEFPDVDLAGNTQAAWLAQTYFDSLRTGVTRTYWFQWSPISPNSLLGVITWPGTKASKTFEVIEGWLTKAEWKGCTATNGLIECAIANETGDGTIVWSQTGEQPWVAKGSVSQMCQIDGRCTKSTTKEWKVGEAPILVYQTST